MEHQGHTNEPDRTDLRDLYGRIGRTEVNVAALQSGLESLSRSTENGFEQISQEIRGLSAARPQLGMVASIGISALVVAGSLAGFALKATVSPIQRDILANERIEEIRGHYQEQLRDKNFEFLDRRMTAIEKTVHPGQDARQDSELDALRESLRETCR